MRPHRARGFLPTRSDPGGGQSAAVPGSEPAQSIAQVGQCLLDAIGVDCVLGASNDGAQPRVFLACEQRSQIRAAGWRIQGCAKRKIARSRPFHSQGSRLAVIPSRLLDQDLAWYRVGSAHRDPRGAGVVSELRSERINDTARNGIPGSWVTGI